MVAFLSQTGHKKILHSSEFFMIINPENRACQGEWDEKFSRMK